MRTTKDTRTTRTEEQNNTITASASVPTVHGLCQLNARKRYLPTVEAFGRPPAKPSCFSMPLPILTVRVGCTMNVFLCSTVCCSVLTAVFQDSFRPGCVVVQPRQFWSSSIPSSRYHYWPQKFVSVRAVTVRVCY